MSKTILQQPVKVNIGSREYSVPQPSIGTLILASEAISKLPAFNISMKDTRQETLRIARDCNVIGDIVAIFILGAKNIKTDAKYLFGIRRKKLAKKIIDNVSPVQLNEILAEILGSLQTDFFLGTLDFLIKVNMIHPTTTASGQ